MRISHPLVPAFAAAIIVISPIGAASAAPDAVASSGNGTRAALDRSPSQWRNLH